MPLYDNINLIVDHKAVVLAKELQVSGVRKDDVAA